MAPRPRSRASRTLALAVAAVALVAPSCGSDEADSAPLTDASGTGPLQFTAPLVGGGTFDGASYSDRPVAFWFWAPT